MAGNALNVEDLQYCTRMVAELLNYQCEYFLFFGSLLGYVRDASPIHGDDDVDFYIDSAYAQATKKLMAQNGFNIVIDGTVNGEDYFLQYYKEQNGHKMRADFYFFYRWEEEYLTDCWNFHAKPKSSGTWLKIPVPLVYPIEQVRYCNTKVFVPKHSKILCEFLYGSSWRDKKKKGIDYHTLVVGGRPLNVKKTNSGLIVLP